MIVVQKMAFVWLNSTVMDAKLVIHTNAVRYKKSNDNNWQLSTCMIPMQS